MRLEVFLLRTCFPKESRDACCRVSWLLGECLNVVAGELFCEEVYFFVSGVVRICYNRGNFFK